MKFINTAVIPPLSNLWLLTDDMVTALDSENIGFESIEKIPGNGNLSFEDIYEVILLQKTLAKLLGVSFDYKRLFSEFPKEEVINIKLNNRIGEAVTFTEDRLGQYKEFYVKKTAGNVVVILAKKKLERTEFVKLNSNKLSTALLEAIYSAWHYNELFNNDQVKTSTNEFSLAHVLNLLIN